MSDIGAILITVGFLLGVYCGVLLSLRSVLVTEKGEVKQGKLVSVTLLTVVSVVMIFIGQYMFFVFR